MSCVSCVTFLLLSVHSAIAYENAGDFTLVGLPSTPIVLSPGEVMGDGDFHVAFQPSEVDRDRLATIDVTYVADEITGATATATGALCGEGFSRRK